MKTSEYTPDILNCLANLSSDEVFTPPEVANQMLDLLPQELFSSPDTKFLDPCCKSGVFLREIVSRLIAGLEKEIPDLQDRVNHIFTSQIYGIPITELTAHMSRRTVYCSKTANGEYSVCTRFGNEQGNLPYTMLQHTWDGDKCSFCGANKIMYNRSGVAETYAYPFIHTKNPKEIFNMQFDVIIGNPPYQLKDGGAKASAKPLYPYFVNNAIKLNPKYLVMIIPARWYSGGKNLDSFRNQMLHDNRVREIHDFNNSAYCFPSLGDQKIKGGICYFLWEKDYSGDCTVYNRDNDVVISKEKRPLLESGCNAFIRYNQAIDILRKIQSQKEKSFSTIVHPAMTFGFRTYFKDFDSQTFKEGMVKVYANHSQGYIKRDSIVKGLDYIDKWKIYIPEASGDGNMEDVVLKPIIGEPLSISTETYIMNGPYNSKSEAENASTYIKTKFFHFMLGLKKITQHTTIKVYQLVPLQDFSHPWTDKMLYEKYKLTDEEIAFIESMIKPMED